MSRLLFILLLSTGGILFATQARADGPCRADFRFSFNVTAGLPQCNGFGGTPWYLFFPVDPCMMGPLAPPNRYPNWPATFPPPDAAQCGFARMPVSPPGTSLRRFPDWPTQFPAIVGVQPTSAAYSQPNPVPASDAKLTRTTHFYSPNWAPTYPASWQPSYNYWR